jgi:hypothetical protein
MTSLLSALILTLAAHAYPNLDIQCQPVHGFDSPLAVSWDQVVDIVGVHATMPANAMRIEVKSKVQLGGTTQPSEVTDVYALAPASKTTLLRDAHESNGPALDSAAFVIENIDLPPSAGPVPPGTYSATAALVLVASHRTSPGKPLVVETRQIDLVCAFSVRP